MRTVRPLLAAAVALATVLVVAPTPAGAAGPAAPYTAMSVEGRDTYVLDPSDATVILSENSPNRLEDGGSLNRLGGGGSLNGPGEAGSLNRLPDAG